VIKKRVFLIIFTAVKNTAYIGVKMSSVLIEGAGSDIAGTSELIFYNRNGVYTLLGGTPNTTAADSASTGITPQASPHF